LTVLFIDNYFFMKIVRRIVILITRLPRCLHLIAYVKLLRAHIVINYNYCAYNKEPQMSQMSNTICPEDDFSAANFWTALKIV